MLSDEQANAGNTNHPLHSNGTISIIIVTLNAAATLQNCLDSIYSQAYPDLEIVVMDGGSADGSVNIIQNNDAKIAFYKSEPDNGIYDAMNKAIEHATGKWIYFLGADDVLFPDFSMLANELKNTNAIYYGSVLTKGLKRFGRVSNYHMAKIGIFHQAIIYPAKVFKTHHYNQRYAVFADYALNMECFADKSVKWIFKDHIIANFNHTGISATRPDEVFEKDKSKLIRENFGMFIWLRFLVKQLKKRIL
jgi:glycosyltransferase involved in cell wall biosynthesis